MKNADRALRTVRTVRTGIFPTLENFLPFADSADGHFSNFYKFSKTENRYADVRKADLVRMPVRNSALCLCGIEPMRTMRTGVFIKIITTTTNTILIVYCPSLSLYRKNPVRTVRAVRTKRASRSTCQKSTAKK